jgi:hypothetical protein
MLSALKSRFDDSSAGAQYRYVKGWVEYGNPARAYRELIYLLHAFADLCDQHHIDYWLDWGSLLGFLRHDGGLIPCSSLRHSIWTARPINPAHKIRCVCCLCCCHDCRGLRS